MPNRHSRRFFIFVLILVGLGFFIFLSASLGLLPRDGASFSHLALKQFIYLIIGLAAMLLVSRWPYQYWRNYSTWIFLGALTLTALVFIPNFSLTFGGAQRWLKLGSLSFQPVEFLKLATIIYLSAWLSRRQVPLRSIHYAITPFLGVLALPALLLFLQPDFDGLMIIFVTGLALLIARGVPWRHILLILIILGLGGVALGFFQDHVRKRVVAFFDSENLADRQGIGYQLDQSLIALGSGGLWGRGPGQSLQKFKYLPEPASDSIFSVAGEEFGFMGAAVLVILFLIFGLWGLKIALRAPDLFGRLLGTGVVIMIVTSAFTNIGSMIGVIPLAGTTLPFVSQGGTALVFNLLATGLLLNLAKQRKF